MTLEELKVVISAQTKPIKDGMKDVKNAMKQVETQTKKTTSAMNKDLNKTGNTAKDITAIFKGLAIPMGKIAIIAATIAKTFKTVKESISLAMDATESENLFSVVFGDMTGEMRKWSNELQETLGLNGYTVRKNAGVIYEMTKNMGVAGNEALNLSKDLTMLTEDMASFYNISSEDAFVKITAGLSGEIEPLRRLGIIVNETTVKNYAYANGIARVGAELTEAQKVMARYGVIMQSTSSAQGDLARTIDSPANQLRILKNNLELTKISLGQAFMPIVQIVLPLLNDLVNGLRHVITVVAEFSQALFGKTTNNNVTTTNKQVKATTALGNAYEKAGKQAKGSMAGFDEINNLNKKNADENGATSYSDIETVLPVIGGLNGGPIGDNLTVSPKVQAVVDEIKNKFSEIKEWSNENIKPQFDGIFDGMVTSFTDVGITIQEAWQPILETLKENLKPFLSSLTIESSETLATTLEQMSNGVSLLIETLTPVFNFLSKVWNDVLTDMFTLWEKYGKPIFDKIQEAIQGTGEFLGNVWNTIIKPVINAIIDMATKLWDEHLRDMFLKIGEALGDVILFLLDLWNKGLLPVFNWLVDVFGPIITKILKEIIDIVGLVLGGVADTIGGIMEVLSGIIMFIEGVFTGDWKKAWEGVKKIFKGTWDALVGIVKVPINLIIGLVNGMLDLIGKAVNGIITAVNKLSFNVPNWVPGIGGEKFGFNLSYVTMPQIPKLATGGVITSPTIAMVGEYHGAGTNPEIVAPSNMIRKIVREESGSFDDSRIVTVLYKILDAIKAGKVIAIDGEEFANIVNSAQSNTFRSAGRTTIPV